MVCRRCKKELPEGDTGQCPFCGIQQSTYITPRAVAKPQTKLKKTRAQILTTISFVLIIVVVAVLVPIIRNNNKAELLRGIDEAFEAQDGVVLSARVSRLKRSYPSAKEDIAEAEAKLNILAGITPAPDSDPSLSEEERRIAEEAAAKEVQDMISRVSEGVLGITERKLEGPSRNGTYDYIINWENKSSKAAKEFRMTVKGYDSDGNAVTAMGRSGASLNLRSVKTVPSGAGELLTFLECWDTPVSTVKIQSVTIIYEDDTQMEIPDTVISGAFGD